MTFEVYDSDGYIDDFAPNLAWYNFAEWCAKQGGNLALLADEGYCSNRDALLKELKAARPDDEDIDATRKRLIELAAKCADIVIVSEGPEDGEDGGEEA